MTARSDRKSTRLNSSHMSISYAVFCLKKKKKTTSDDKGKKDEPGDAKSKRVESRDDMCKQSEPVDYKSTGCGHGGGVVGFFFFNDTATTEIYTLSLHDALPISSPKTTLGKEADVILAADGRFNIDRLTS